MAYYIPALLMVFGLDILTNILQVVLMTGRVLQDMSSILV
jgi:hypothetical protein